MLVGEFFQWLDCVLFIGTDSRDYLILLVSIVFLQFERSKVDILSVSCLQMDQQDTPTHDDPSVGNEEDVQMP